MIGNIVGLAKARRTADRCEHQFHNVANVDEIELVFSVADILETIAFKVLNKLRKEIVVPLPLDETGPYDGKGYLSLRTKSADQYFRGDLAIAVVVGREA